VTTRPDPGTSPVPGYEHVPVVDPEWRVLGPSAGERTCAATRGQRRGQRCGAEAVAEKDHRYHGQPGNWRAYCAEHVAEHRRWVEEEDGTVMRWTVRRIGRESA
jgi:hypothetical protein